MLAVPKKVSDRIVRGMKQYVPILTTQRDRDISEADTVTVVKDLLSDVFGFDKYVEITGEYAIRGTRCDLAIKLDSKLKVLIEVKAIGATLNDRHVKQAIDYAANQGVEWVILTNGLTWILYHVIFKQPIDKEEVATIDMLSVDCKKDHDLERLFLLSKEGITREALGKYRDLMDATNRYMIAAILVNSEPIMATIRREVRRVSEMLVDPSVIAKTLRDEVIKRDLLEGPQADDAKKRYGKRAERLARRKRKSSHERAEPQDENAATPK